MDLNRLFSIGFTLAIFLIIQVLTGITLSWSFNNANNFISIHYQLFEFNFGLIIQSTHMNLTNLIFLLIYIHIFKVIYLFLVFDSSILIWSSGFMIYILLSFITFIGYVLPMSQLSYWGLTVFSNIITTLPIGNLLISWFWSGEFINNITLIKLHSLHIILPIILILLLLIHIFLLHLYLSSDSLDRFVFYLERILFSNWYYVRDFILVILLLILLNFFTYIYWYIISHEESWTAWNSFKTPEKVIPEWLVEKRPSWKWVFFWWFLLGLVRTSESCWTGNWCGVGAGDGLKKNKVGLLNNLKRL